MTRVELLDCTLRDGGWMNGFGFGTRVMQQIFQAVRECGIEYAELGYLDLKAGSPKERSMYCDLEAVRTNGLTGGMEEPAGDPGKKMPCRFVMIDVGKFPAELLPARGLSGIDGIRVCFHKKDAAEAFRTGRKILELGYRLVLQPMVNTRYSEQEFDSLIRAASGTFPELTAFYIVDSFGSMGPEEMCARVQQADALLSGETAVGLHTHNSRGLSFRNAAAAAMLPLHRTLMLDASICGIGKGAGNLRTEEICRWLNREKGGAYRPEALRPAEEMLTRLLSEVPKIPAEAFLLSAEYRLTPSYAAFFWQQKDMTEEFLAELLRNVPDRKKDSFDRETAQEIFLAALQKKEKKGTI